MDDVASAAGVSRALVSLVMRGSPKVSERRRAAVLAAADELGYRPNAAARSLAEQRSNTIGVVVSDLHNTFFADVVDGIHDRAVEHNYQLLIGTAWRKDADERRAIESFLELRVDAVIVVGSQAPHGVLSDAAKRVPVVSVAAVVPGVDVIVSDDELGGVRVVEHLIDLGHRDIVHLDGGDGGGATRRRLGYTGAMEVAGLTPRVIRGEYTEAAGMDGVELMLTERTLPTAIFAANDLVALGVIDRLGDDQLRVPTDVSVVGYDNTSLAGLRHIGLTTINQPRYEMGAAAIGCVLDRLDGGRREAVTHVVEPELIVRSTTSRASDAR